MNRLLAIALVLPISAAAQDTFTEDDAQILQKGLTVTADTVILPNYEAYADAAGRLEITLGAYCDGTGDIDAVHDAYADAFLGWQRASLVQVGPVMEGDGPMRFQLWPDPKSFSSRAVRQAVGAEDPALLAPGGLEGRSIALFNLTALEDLAYSDTAPGTYACDLARAIAAHQAMLGEDIAAAWRPGSEFRNTFDTAAAGNATWSGVEGPLRELLAGLIVHADRVRDQKIERGLGTMPGEARAERTEAASSGLGLDSIRVSFDALSDMLNAPGGVFAVTPRVGASEDYYMIAKTAENVALSLEEENHSLTQIAEEDGDRAADLRTLAELIDVQETYFRETLPGMIGLTSGFTASDGD